MILKQYYLGCLSQASYLIGDESTRTAVVVDPRRDIEEYLEDAAEAGLRIEHVILTHFHADFVAGHLELRERTGARIHLGARASAEYEFSPLADGDVLEWGQVRLTIMETPGHTPEAISVLVFDLARDRERPQAVLTGDTLFIGDVGRPDLMASVGASAQELAGQLYASVHRLLQLPDETLVYPGHGAGSACGKNLSSETVSTIGAQRRENGALQPMSQEAFVKLVTADQPKAPAYFGYDAQLNRRQRSTLEAALARELAALPLEAVLRAQSEGAQVLDVRDPDDYAAGAPGRQHQREPPDPLRVVGRGVAHPGPAHRHRGRAGPRARGGRAARPHRVRQRARPPRWRHRRRAEPAGGHPARPVASPAPSWRASCASGASPWSTSGSPGSGRRERFPAP